MLDVRRRPYRLPAAPVAAFSGTPLIADVGQAVVFTDGSTNNPHRYAWDFGDGETSTVRNPSHAFAAAGVYDVSLTTRTGGGSDAEVKAAYVHVRPPAPPSVSVTNYAAGAWIKAARTCGLLFQDHARTFLARLANDPVRVIVDPYTGVVWEWDAVDNRATLQTDGLDHWWVQNLTGSSNYSATLGAGLFPRVNGGCSGFGRASATAVAGDSISVGIGVGGDGAGTFLSGGGSQQWKTYVGGVQFGDDSGVVETGLWKTVGFTHDSDNAELKLFIDNPTTEVNTLPSLLNPPSNALSFRVAGRNAVSVAFARELTDPEQAIVFADLAALAVN